MEEVRYVLRGLLRCIKKKIVRWLLDIDELRVERAIKVGNTIIITGSFIDFEKLVLDPTLAEGRVWYRSDLGELRVSDGSKVLTLSPSKILRSGRYYGSFDTAATFTTLTISANTLYATPFFVPHGARFDSIAINVTTASSGRMARVGIYTDSGDAYPYALVPGTDVGELDVGTTGVKQNVIDVTLHPGLYWLALVSNGSPTLRAIPVGSLDSEVLGLGSDLGTVPGVGYTISYTYAPLPSTFPTGASIHTSTIPLVAVRKA